LVCSRGGSLTATFATGQSRRFYSGSRSGCNAVGVAIAFHLRVLIHEEPKLAELFGDEFAAYRRRVPRWIPRFTPGTRTE
jgi:protein-S-isoprenylcysteine O-methyltransferase Ste14